MIKPLDKPGIALYVSTKTTIKDTYAAPAFRQALSRRRSPKLMCDLKTPNPRARRENRASTDSAKRSTPPFSPRVNIPLFGQGSAPPFLAKGQHPPFFWPRVNTPLLAKVNTLFWPRANTQGSTPFWPSVKSQHHPFGQGSTPPFWPKEPPLCGQGFLAKGQHHRFGQGSTPFWPSVNTPLLAKGQHPPFGQGSTPFWPRFKTPLVAKGQHPPFGQGSQLDHVLRSATQANAIRKLFARLCATQS